MPSNVLKSTSSGYVRTITIDSKWLLSKVIYPITRSSILLWYPLPVKESESLQKIIATIGVTESTNYSQNLTAFKAVLSKEEIKSLSSFGDVINTFASKVTNAIVGVAQLDSCTNKPDVFIKGVQELLSPSSSCTDTKLVQLSSKFWESLKTSLGVYIDDLSIDTLQSIFNFKDINFSDTFGNLDKPTLDYLSLVPEKSTDLFFKGYICAITGKMYRRLDGYMSEDDKYFLSHDSNWQDNPSSGWIMSSVTNKPIQVSEATEYINNYGRRFMCSKTTAADKVRAGKFFVKDNVLYSFDIFTYSQRILFSSYIKPSDLSRGSYTEVAPEVFLPSDFEIMEYDTNILDYVDGFKSMPYETTVRGSKDKSKNTLFMGVELETEMASNANMYASQAARYVIGKMKGECVTVYDGSLDDGFEIVTIPATLDYHYNLWKDLCCSEIRHEIVSWKRENCGLHIHMSKEAFTDLALGKFITFINSSENSEFITAVAARKSNSYCQRKDSKVVNGRFRDNFVDASGARHDKYWATNLVNEHTVEVRMFKGTLAYGGIMRSLEFVHALHRYSSSALSSCRSTSYKDFLKWFTDKKNGMRKLYPYLWGHLVNRDFIVDTSSLKTKVGDVPDVLDENRTVSTNFEYSVPQSKLEMYRKAAVRK